jgi:hypothetical protein
MDRQQRTLDVVKALNAFNKGDIPPYKLLSEVCEYFDYIKDEYLDDADKRFLLYLSNKAGIPQYYDILYKFNNNHLPSIDDDYLGLNTFSALMYEASLYTDEDSKLHQFQMDVLNLFHINKRNRFFLSASTSFGKTHLVYEVIKKMKYKNVVLIFPSIALLSENLSKIKDKRVTFNLDYKIHTLSDIDDDYGEANIFIFTPERFLSFLDKDRNQLNIDFIFVDEIYKIDNGYIIDNESKENERDVAYRMAVFYGMSKYTNVDLLLAGPYIEVLEESSIDYNPSFDRFLNDFSITKLLRNEYEIVKVSKTHIEGEKGNIDIDGILFNFKAKPSKKLRIQEIVEKFISLKENLIIYCNTQANAERVANEIERVPIQADVFSSFLNHLKATYNSDWIVIKSLEKGIGVHHGVVPKYIQKEIISLFNSHNSGIDILTSTTTITEGVNTTAKNMLVYKSEKGGGTNGKPLLTFDAKNIAGRAGRFMEHYKGRVISLDKKFIDVIDSPGNPIEHTNYQLLNNRKEIDDEMTPNEFLDDRSKERIEEVTIAQNLRGIPDNIITQFKVISRRDKISVFDEIGLLSPLSISHINRLINDLHSPNLSLYRPGFQVVLETMKKFIPDNSNLYFLIDRKYRDKELFEASVITASLQSYLYEGYMGVYNYNYQRLRDKAVKKDELLKAEGKNNDLDKALIGAVNEAMRLTSTLIFNTFKYQLVKYLGVFNLMYKFKMSQLSGKSFDEQVGIEKLLIKLEYNAFTQEGRMASDYGVPQKIVDYYDSELGQARTRIMNSFDDYEKQVFQKIKRIIEE